MNVLVIGFGNAGSGIAADLSLKGHTVSVLKTSTTIHAEHFRHVLSNHHIVLVERGMRRIAHLACLTRNPAEAFSTVPDVVVVTTQTLQHEHIFDIIRPFLKDDSVLLLEPGNAGSLLFAKSGIPRGMCIAEATSTPIDVRINKPGEATVLFRNVRNPLGFLPFSLAHQALNRLQLLYNNFYSIGNALVSALHNPNLIVHTTGSLLSVPRIEYASGEFWMYKEGFTKSVWNVIEALDSEKMAVLQLLGAEPIPYLEIAKLRNAEDLSISARAMFELYCQTASPKGPATINTRYIYEDVPKGLVLLESLGHLVQHHTPTASLLIALAQIYTGEHFRTNGSSLQRLGIQGLSKEEVLHWLKSGQLVQHSHIHDRSLETPKEATPIR